MTQAFKTETAGMPAAGTPAAEAAEAVGTPAAGTPRTETLAAGMHTEFTLLVDGSCPLCKKEVAWLSCWNKRGGLVFQDITAEGVDLTVDGKSRDELLAEIHGIYPDGRVVRGMDAVRAAYGAVGLGWLLAPTALPIIRPLFDGFYRRFAQGRSALGQLCRRLQRGEGGGCWIGRCCSGCRCGSCSQERHCLPSGCRSK